jgi:hypothetical protein
MLALLSLVIGCGPAAEDVAVNLSSPNPVVREDSAKIARNNDSIVVHNALIVALSDSELAVRVNAIESLVS